jgi:osmotically-inducible protein OsmY
VAEAGREAASAAGAAIETMDVKTALMRDTRVDAGDIDVDTNHETRTVVLKGSCRRRRNERSPRTSPAPKPPATASTTS